MTQLSRAIWIGAGVAAVALGIVFAVKTARQMRELEARLEDSRRQNESLKGDLARYEGKLKATAESAEAAREQAGRAEQLAGEAAAGRSAAEEEARRAAEAAARANQELATGRQELEAMRKRRQEELDRMQEALSKIAPTRRTASGMVIELTNESFYFDFDKASLRPENREVLSRIAGILLASKGYRLFIYGHTDDVGTEEYNQGLSERRAQAVMKYLAGAGIPENMMQVQGFGKKSPRVNATTTAARQKNRRVEIGVVDTIIHYQGPVAQGARQ